jgi:hypothetical protein
MIRDGMKRPREEPRNVESKSVKVGENGESRSVAEVGTPQQQRAAATASISPDAVRFVPPQVARKKNLL